MGHPLTFSETPQNSSRFLNIPYDSLRFLKVSLRFLWDPWDPLKIPYDSLRLLEIPGDSLRFLWGPWDPINIH